MMWKITSRFKLQSCVWSFLSLEIFFICTQCGKFHNFKKIKAIFYVWIYKVPKHVLKPIFVARIKTCDMSLFLRTSFSPFTFPFPPKIEYDVHDICQISHETFFLCLLNLHNFNEISQTGVVVKCEEKDQMRIPI